MVNSILSVLSVVLFCVCCHQFIKVVVTPAPRLNTSGYSRVALRMKRVYSIFSWGTMTGVFLLALVVSFYQVYTQL